MATMDYPSVDVAGIPSPAVLVFKPLLEHNLEQMLAIAGSPSRLRPHCKTHKTREIIKLLLERAVQRHKCATLREVAMCIEAGARDIVLAYQLVGPQVEQLVSLAAREPSVRLAALVDCDAAVDWLSRAASAAGVTVGAMVDLDTGLHRTGLPVGEGAMRLYRHVAQSPGLRPAGLHIYDAQNNHHPELADRAEAVERTIAPVLGMAEMLRREGHDVPELLCGGTGTFPCYARYGGPITCSPGTMVFWDAGYASSFPDLDARLAQAAVLLGRVVSRPTPQHVTLDLGTKGIASDPPVGRRGVILGLEDAVTTLHNEEHWVVTSERAGAYHVGDPVFIVPTHICPNTNLYPLLYIIDARGRVIERWEVVARQRPLVL
jgi:D-serine deaminase-like pyridoxal phosphate-dependent protein